MVESTDIFGQYNEEYIDYSTFLYGLPNETEIANSSVSASSTVLSSRKRKIKRSDFTTTEKQKLAGLIKENEAIWNLNNKLHRNNHAVAAQWKNVASAMEFCIIIFNYIHKKIS